jgi:hypothetical protein
MNGGVRPSERLGVSARRGREANPMEGHIIE